jgi:serine/threonine protein kinase
MLHPGAKDKRAPLLPGIHAKGDAIAGRYRVEKLLGATSFGYVVVARHVYLRERVRLKILAPMTDAQQKAQRRSLTMAHLVATLRGRHVARIVDTGFTEQGLPFIATEHHEGPTLADELSRRGRLSAPEAVRWVLEACEALAEAHAAGIVHGSLKPQNLLLASTEDTTHRGLHVLDFGSPNPFLEDGPDDGLASMWFTSPAYLAPEQLTALDDVGPRADIWALGVILHQLASGALPFEADTVSGMLVSVMQDDPAPLATPDAPCELARVIHACLAKDPARRPPDVATLARLLAPFAGAEGEVLAAAVESAAATPPTPLPPEKDPPEQPAAPPFLEPHASPPSVVAAEPEDERREKTRLRAKNVAMVAATAALTVAGMLAKPPSLAAPTDDTSPAHEPDLTAKPLVPRSVPVDPHAQASTSSATPPAPVTHRIETIATQARTLANEMPVYKSKATLPPIPPRDRTAGFTHPTRLAEPRTPR